MSYRLVTWPLLVLCATLLLAGCENSEERAERHYQSALKLLEEGDPERALIELRNVVKFDDEHQDGRLLFAQTLAEQGAVQEAISQYLLVSEQYPDLLEARIPLTRMSLELNAWEEAARHGRAARELDPKNVEVIFLNAALDYREAALSDDTPTLESSLYVAQNRLVENPSDRLAWRLVIDHAVTNDTPEIALQQIDSALSHLPEEYDLYLAKLRILDTQKDATAIGAVLQTMSGRFVEDLRVRNMLLAWYLEQGDTIGAEAFLRQLANAPDAGVNENLRIVDFLRHTYSIDRARTELDRLIAKNPDEITYLATHAALDFESGSTDTAIATMKDVLTKAAPSEDTASLKVNLARMLVSEGQISEAKTIIDEVLSDTQGHVEALKMQAVWQIEDDRPDDAILTLRTAQAGAPRDPDIMILMGQAHERAGARELAGERYALAVEASGRASAVSLRYADFLLQQDRPDIAEIVIADALNVSPSDVDLLAVMAEIQLRQQDWDRIPHLLSQLRAQSTPAALAVADRIETAFLLQRSQTEDAIAFLGDLLAEDANDAVALASLVSTYVQNGKLDNARTLLEARLQQDPKNPNLRFVRAGLHVVEGQEAQAEVIYRALLQEFPGAPQPLRQLNRILVSQEREEEVAELIEIATAAQPDALFPQLLKAEQLERLQDFESAIALYEDIYGKNTDNLVFANNLASLISTHRDDEESLSRAYTIARRLKGSDIPAFQDTYGWIAFRRGKHEEALNHLEPAAAGLPDNSLVQYHLGEVYVALGRTEDAQDTLNKAVELSATQEFPQIERAKELLDALSEQN